MALTTVGTAGVVQGRGAGEVHRTGGVVRGREVGEAHNNTEYTSKSTL